MAKKDDKPEVTEDTESKSSSAKPEQEEATQEASDPQGSKADDTENKEQKAEAPAEEEEMTDTPEDKEYVRAGFDKNIWLRGLWMIVLAILFGVAETILLFAAVIQFFWLLFAKEKNQFIADFGKDLSAWLAKTAQFQTGASEEKPFPWTRWKS
jgi:hypothetical protein